jgi:uronate dehydrogenase
MASRDGARIAVTGAAGSLASDVLPGLADLGHRIVGVDRVPAPVGTRWPWVLCDITDRAGLRPAFNGCDAVVHLAGIPLEADWDRIMRANIDGTQAVLETARRAGVPRVVLASSIHAAGFVPPPDDGAQVPDDVPIRPNTFYGVSKAAVEALGSLYHDRYGMDVVCLRIASRFPRPLGERMLSTWLSPADAVRLFDAALTVPAPGFRIVWGVSANRRSHLSPAGGASIGFHPHDDAEDHADHLFATAAQDPAVLASDWDQRFIGGDFCSPDPPMHRGAAVWQRRASGCRTDRPTEPEQDSV